MSSNGISLIVGSYYGDLIGIDLRKPDIEVMRYKGHSKQMITAVDFVWTSKELGLKFEDNVNNKSNNG